MSLSLCLVGCGSMGSSLLKGWLTLPHSTSRFKNLWVVAPHREKVTPFLTDPRVVWFSSPMDLPAPPDLFVFAVKPFHLQEILLPYTAFKSLMISVASGKPLSFYEDVFDEAQPIIRAMPNTPVCIHQGVIALLANHNVNKNHKLIAQDCFQGLGYCPWVKTDEEIDKITAISGSGPAYVFFVIEALAEAAESLGFDKHTALNLSLNTFLGASQYAIGAEHAPHILRKHVTSPQGTTEAALNVLEKGHLKEHMEKAVSAAFKRAKELSQ